ncbi:response regulator [Siphonobacter aquaeclarae]|jgi:two-component system copper resistance phosphate regulon response regulator CusR|uniref:Two-component system, OmpR family, copper resistance phosphate regulon response regulator CusR n=1 Tax=Siphonobacter aquaeclarae TaxID=563176 RepID=A0A1G9S0U9_9BACT|nr:response regulator [Siphonobacter aquaeclarae]MBO9638377.1 response regulator [Siphonobacter aquaeclarae]SDM29178.1 two-component system, OmpR family, copper resistance phosphate regulon response regulator CusR [Siphonobacter aquaeclarae]
MRLLIIEDEPKTVQSVRQGLEENGYEVDIAYDGLIGKHLAKKNPYDLIVSDIIMPGLNGVELTRELRSEGVETPVLLLTALGSIDEKLMGFDAGADDYLVKPFEFAELLARIRVLTRRWNGSIPIASNILRYADLEMNLDSKTVTRNEKKIDLTAREFALLEYMLRNQGKVLSKSEISEKVWDVNFDTGTNVIEVYINLLRKKVDKDFSARLIHTQYGMGYVLKLED